MPIYVYETVPARKGQKPRVYEIEQRMTDATLTHHPHTGEALRKVYTAPAVVTASGGSDSPASCCREYGQDCCSAEGGGGCPCAMQD